MLLFTYQGKDWHSFTPSVCLTEVWKATVDNRMVSKGMWLSQYAPKGVKSLCITSSQTVYVRKPDLVSSKTLERLGGQLIYEIYLNTYFQRARLGGRLICEIGLYASIYGKVVSHAPLMCVRKLSYSGGGLLNEQEYQDPSHSMML